MDSQIKVVLLSFIISIVTALVILPLLKKLRVGQIEREYGPRSHLIKEGTPTMGGIIIAITLLIMSLILYSSYKRILPLSLIMIGFGMIGFVDDFKKLIFKDTEGLKPAYKILRSTYCISNLCIIFDKYRNRYRNFNSYIKSIYKNTNSNIFAIYDICNACINKCSEPYRWNRWLRGKYLYDNNCLPFSDCN